jgi:hypothetical protein
MLRNIAAAALLAVVGMASVAVAGTVMAPAAGRLVPATDLQADAAILRRAYEALHPALYRYRTKAQIDAAFAALEGEFTRDRTLADAYLAIARLTTFIQCGHTYPNFFNQGQEVERTLLKRPRVPFEFRWLDRRMVVTRTYVDMPGLQRGTEVLSIDGRPVAAILAGLLPYSRADGGNDAKRILSARVSTRREQSLPAEGPDNSRWQGSHAAGSSDRPGAARRNRRHAGRQCQPLELH